MTLTFVKGNIFDADVEALVNPVNCVGVMGAGLAKQFKERYPDYFADYYLKCRRGEIRLGWADLYEIAAPVTNPLYLISAATKRHWRDQSQLRTIPFLLGQIMGLMMKHKAKSVAVPALGCGLGGLSWANVRPKFELAASYKPSFDMLVYEPGE